MENRKLLIQKKSELIKSKKQMNDITAVSVIDFIESDSNDIGVYKNMLQDLCNYKLSPPLATKKKDANTDNTIT